MTLLIAIIMVDFRLCNMFETLSYFIQTSFRWILRSKYSRGFGIQSPSAYEFVRYVVNEHYPYYAYQDLENQMKSQSRLFRKLGRLFFRLTNFWQPNEVLISNNKFVPYIQKACQKVAVKEFDLLNCEFKNTLQPLFVILDMDDLCTNICRNKVFGAVSDKMLLVVTNIHSRKSYTQLWNEIIAYSCCGVTYDLYSCGIIFFDKSKHKQNFKINF